jgi:hypothetical protein
MRKRDLLKYYRERRKKNRLSLIKQHGIFYFVGKVRFSNPMRLNYCGCIPPKRRKQGRIRKRRLYSAIRKD